MKIAFVLCMIITRILLSGYFIAASLIKIFSWGIEERQLFESLTLWEQIIPQNGLLFTIFIELLQAPTILIGISFGTYLVLGVLFLLGVRKFLCVSMLSLSLLISAFLFHPFWIFEGEQFDTELLAFAMNIALIGGLFTHILFDVERKAIFENDQSSFRMKLREDD